MKANRVRLVLCLTLAATWTAAAQQIPVPASPAMAPEEFFRTADELLQEVSAHLGLPIKTPLKKSLRSRQEIREFMIRQLREEQRPEKLYADQIALTKFGLFPKGFELEPFLIDLLTEQVAGLYDPKGQEFYIADWLSAEEMRFVMVHELVHALHDQHFQLKPWLDAARPNDDAQLARHAVEEGAAMLVTLEFTARDMGLPVFSAHKMGDLTVFLRSTVAAGLGSGTMIAKAPAYLRDALMFSYIEGAIFSQQVLKNGTGWDDFNRVFANPPVSSQQILHPELYVAGVAPRDVELAAADSAVPRRWKKLDQNHIGEFGLRAILKEFLGEETATQLAPGWAGDTYAVFEDPQTKRAALLYRMQLKDEVAAVRFFGAYSDALEKKHEGAREFFRRPNFFAFETDDGGVFLHCAATDCLVLEGADRAVFDAVSRKLKRPKAPAQPPTSRRRIAQQPAAAAGTPALQ